MATYNKIFKIEKKSHVIQHPKSISASILVEYIPALCPTTISIELLQIQTIITMIELMMGKMLNSN